ncbi:MAG: hypothetical protein IPK68_01835 [Bdellovibrionales bacterium]|nr:hypothetical protein [Bdellovibrionales bacterium]
MHPRKVTDIEGGKRIEFSWRGTPYWIDLKNGKGGNLEKPVEWSNRRYEPRLSLASVLGTIRIEGEDILQLDTAWDGQAIVLLTRKDNHITFRVYLNEYTPEFDSEYIEVPRDPSLPRPVFHLSHQSLLPGVKRGDLSFYSRENTRLVVGDIGSKFFYVVGPSGEIRIAMAHFDEVSRLPVLVDENITPKMSDIFVTYRDGEGSIRGATVYELSTFLVMAVHLPKQNSNGIGWPHWIGVGAKREASYQFPDVSLPGNLDGGSQIDVISTDRNDEGKIGTSLRPSVFWCEALISPSSRLRHPPQASPPHQARSPWSLEQQSSKRASS